MEYLLPKNPRASPYKDIKEPITILEAAYYVAGKAVMLVLCGEEFESAEILHEDDEPIIENNNQPYKKFQRINNVTDFSPVSTIKPEGKRVNLEQLFLVVSSGIWCQNIYLFNKENTSNKQATIEDIQTLMAQQINKLLALRTLVENLKWNYVVYEPQIEEDILLDHEALLYRQGFTLVSQTSVWSAVTAVAKQIAGKKILPAQEIYNLCSAQNDFDDIKNEVTLFYSIKRA